ncbi:MAG: hypothetical protein AAGG50_08790 [Bacteroidota bacterium]
MLLFLLAPTAAAQPDASRLDLATHTLGIEIGGNAAPVSVTLDFPVSRVVVMRVGAMVLPFWGERENDTFRSPFGVDEPDREPPAPTFAVGSVTASRLFGQGRARLELGGGLMGRSNATENPDYFPSTIGLTGIAGFRVQPERGDFGVRITFTPLVDRRGVHPLGGFTFIYGFP